MLVLTALLFSVPPPVPPPAPLSSAPGDTTRTAEQPPELEVDVGGALRYNYVYRDYREADAAEGGQLLFDTFRINAEATYGPIRSGAEYRFYAGYHMLKTGWVGYQASDEVLVQAGVHQVPFGITTYASNSWFFQLPYYAGLEDDHDAGLKATYTDGPLTVAGAFYKQADGPFTGSSLASARYSYDVVPAREGALDYGSAPVAEARSNREVNQGNLKATYTLEGGAVTAELGASGQYGGLYNDATERMGSHWAAAGHANVTAGPINAKLQLIRYEHAPENPAGQDSDFVVFGAYDFPYKVAADGTFYSAALNYSVPMPEDGLVSTVNVYNDFSYLDKDPAAYSDTIQNITGVSVGAGPVFTYFDLVLAKNHPFAIVGSDFAAALAEGSDEWHARFNVNLGLYF
ncbi:MAG TPA: hypothetical protein EYQ24_09770 [Bacteroidetes bacterium]|nr:hypothetical protein [Bacteroidota bacterium]